MKQKKRNEKRKNTIRRRVLQAIFDIQRGERDRKVATIEIHGAIPLSKYKIRSALGHLVGQELVIPVGYMWYTLNGSALAMIDTSSVLKKKLPLEKQKQNE